MKYRKKPVVIEAFRWGRDPMPVWFVDAVRSGVVAYEMADDESVSGCPCHIYTLEGEMRADVGDWIIQGVKGELYPCKADVFAVTYEAAE